MDYKAKMIIAENLFLTLATVSQDNNPWSTPLYYAVDEHYIFYWYSRKDTQHSQNIQNNQNVTASIYTSNGLNISGGVYLIGKAFEVPENELPHATTVYAAKAATSKEERENLTKIQDYLGDSQLRFYKLVVDTFYISNEATKWNGKWIDSRSEIALK